MSDSNRIICLGKEFSSEEERREYFRNELRTKLPELKKIEGFPIGEDENIINLSDPPYYTACPNPWLNDFITEWEKEKERIPGRKKSFHVDEPYASDVSEGKNNPIYNAHSYHTKVPHPAIMRYILHYTQPGDIILDGFCGTGMTGVAAQMCRRDNFTVSGLNYLEHYILGVRNVILNDLSPIASHISHNYNHPTLTFEAASHFKTVLDEVEIEYGWLYKTNINNNKRKINYVVWSDVFLCPQCNNELNYYNLGYKANLDSVALSIICPNCSKLLEKDQLERAQSTMYDPVLKQTINVNKQLPSSICYFIGKKQFMKVPEKEDLELIKKADEIILNKNYQTFKLQFKDGRWGDLWVPGYHFGVTHSHHFYTTRNYIILNEIWNRLIYDYEKWVFTGFLNYVNKKQSFTGGGGGMPAVLYIASLVQEKNIFDVAKRKVKAVNKGINNFKREYINSIIECQSTTQINLKENSVDYIFTDPPFGRNIMYSEGSFLWEAWLKVFMNNKKESIINKQQCKSINEYHFLIFECFQCYFKVLKPGKWITVEFSNTKAAIWNGIQTALQKAGFIIANVSGLDKKQGSFKAVTTPTAVKQDLVISCYKPSQEFENKFNGVNGKVAVLDFVSEHLAHLPVHFNKDGSTTAIIERSPKILYDRLITFYLMRSIPVPIDAKDFQEVLRQRFIERDGMYFTAEQAAEYDEKKAKAPQFVQLSLIVSNESDAIEWLKDRLRKQSQKYQDIMPDFLIAAQSPRKGDTLPELQVILHENFIQESDGRWRTPDPNEAKDREAIRINVLLKEFNGYVTAVNQARSKKLKEVRVEALRTGFKKCWEQKDFKTIVTLGDMIPQNILLEDEQLLMYYDIAKDRI